MESNTSSVNPVERVNIDNLFPAMGGAGAGKFSGGDLSIAEGLSKFMDLISEFFNPTEIPSNTNSSESSNSTQPNSQANDVQPTRVFKKATLKFYGGHISYPAGVDSTFSINGKDSTIFYSSKNYSPYFDFR